MRIALGISGGVDSAVSAHLLTQAGHQVTAVYLECWKAPGCRTEEDRADALKVALALQLPFQVLDFKQQYKDKVVSYFFSAFQAGQTPNPDTMCNQEIKFGLFYDWAMTHGFDAIATGHYAKIVDVNQQKFLAIPADQHKDQTYFLYLLTQTNLEHACFPLADLTKTQVRALAKKFKVHVADKKDSTGICFIGEINVADFLKQNLGQNPGEVIDTSGVVVGRHQGLWFHTIGQRGGFTLNPTSVIDRANHHIISRHNIPPFYVIAKKPATNQLVVGFGAETAQTSFMINQPHWINPQTGLQLVTTASSNHSLYVRVRHTGQLLACTITTQATGLIVKLSAPTRGLADGQAAVFYTQLDEHLCCLGGGEIVNFAI